MYHYGETPSQVDHINRNKSDDRIENLREASTSTNNINRNPYSNTNEKLIYLRKDTGKYKVSMFLGKKYKYIGQRKILKEAILLRNKYLKENIPERLQDL